MSQTHRRASLLTTLVVLCITTVGCATVNVSPSLAIDEAKAVVRSHEDFTRAGDLDRVMSNMAEDIVVLADDTPLIKGKAAVRDFYVGLLRMGRFDFGHDYEGAEVLGQAVVLHGVARGTLTPPSGSSGRFANNFVLVLKRQPDGRLRFWRIAFAPSGSSM